MSLGCIENSGPYLSSYIRTISFYGRLLWAYIVFKFARDTNTCNSMQTLFWHYHICHIFLETTLASQTAAAVIQPHPRFTKELQNDLSRQLAVAFVNVTAGTRWALFAKLGKPLFHHHHRQGRHDRWSSVLSNGDNLNINVRN